jgi:hypothetical protein
VTGFLDVSSDAWAIDIGKEKERGKIRGSIFAGQYGGMAIGSISLTAVASVYKYETVYFVGRNYLYSHYYLPIIS